MQDKIDALSLEALTSLKEKVDAAFERKMRSLVRPGKEVLFDSSKRGGTVRLYVERVNLKSLTGYEIDQATGEHLKKKRWRVAPQLVRPCLDTLARTDKPTTTPAAW